MLMPPGKIRPFSGPFADFSSFAPRHYLLLSVCSSPLYVLPLGRKQIFLYLPAGTFHLLEGPVILLILPPRLRQFSNPAGIILFFLFYFTDLFPRIKLSAPLIGFLYLAPGIPPALSQICPVVLAVFALLFHG